MIDLSYFVGIFVFYDSGRDLYLTHIFDSGSVDWVNQMNMDDDVCYFNVGTNVLTEIFNLLGQPDEVGYDHFIISVVNKFRDIGYDNIFIVPIGRDCDNWDSGDDFIDFSDCIRLVDVLSND